MSVHASHEALTLHSPVTHPGSSSLTLLARCECLKRHGVGEREGDLGGGFYFHCPAKKWKFEWCFTDLDSWMEPPKQTQTYSGDHWNVRFGWIITEEGITSCLITREAIGPGLASAKEPRLPVSMTPGHARVASSDTDISSLMAPLSITTQSYREDHPNVDYKHIKVKFTSWQETRKGHLNVKTALFFLLMLAGAPGGPKLLQTDYPPLDSWWHEGEHFRHNSTGR